MEGVLGRRWKSRGVGGGGVCEMKKKKALGYAKNCDKKSSELGMDARVVYKIIHR